MSSLSVSSSLGVATLGTPRIGPRRELKSALESYWAGKSTESDLLKTAAVLRAANWARQNALGVTVIPSNDFSLYDHVLDTSVMVGAIPDFYGWKGGEVSLATYFAMARGSQGDSGGLTCTHHHHGDEASQGVPAQEMTKWFDTNYHYMVPEFAADQRFALSSLKALEEYRQAKALGYDTRPVLLGPVTYLKLGKSKDASFDPLSLLPKLLPVYIELLQRLGAEGARWVQLDEPALVLDLDERERQALRDVYGQLARALPQLKIMLATYFGGLGDNLETALGLPVAGLHLDLVRAPKQLNAVVAKAPRDLVLSLGVIDGRNIWRADLPDLLDRLEPIVRQRGAERVQLAPSCSLLHVPVDLELETDLDLDLKSWLSFSLQKMGELATLGRALGGDRVSVQEEIAASAKAAATRRKSPKVHNIAVITRAAAATSDMTKRNSGFAARAALQHQRLRLPPFPTTTIGSVSANGPGP